MEQLNNILLVDDDPVVTFLNETIIKESKIANQITTASNGKEALKILNKYCHLQQEENLPQLIFLDINMPELDGFGFLEAFQHLDIENKNFIIVVVSTGSLHPSAFESIFIYPVNECIEKPLTRKKLNHIMEKYFNCTSKRVVN